MEDFIVRQFGFYPFESTEEPAHNPFSHKVEKELFLDVESNVVKYNYTVVELSPEEIQLKMFELKNAFTFAIESLLDSTVQVRDYKNILHACSYINSIIPQYQAEAVAASQWRDMVWVKAYEIQNEILNSQRQIPTIEEFLAELPALEWPE